MIKNIKQKKSAKKKSRHAKLPDKNFANTNYQQKTGTNKVVPV
jgi:hypothetical protein